MSSTNPQTQNRSNAPKLPSRRETWTMFPSKYEVFIYATREEESEVDIRHFERCGWCLNSTIISAVKRSYAGELQMVSVLIPSDVEMGIPASLIRALTPLAREKNFTLVSPMVPMTSAEILSAFGDDAQSSKKFSVANYKPVTAH
jgi:hypothetical protein